MIAAETHERAEWLAGPSKRKFLGRQLGERILLPSPAEAAAYPYTGEDQAATDAKFAGVVRGSLDTVAEALQTLLDDSELMITTRRRASWALARVAARASQSR